MDGSTSDFSGSSRPAQVSGTVHRSSGSGRTPGVRGFVESPEEIRAQALRFIGLTALLEGVLILTRWVLLPSLKELSNQRPTMPLSGSLAIEFAWGSVYLATACVVLLLRPDPRWTLRTTLILVGVSTTIAVMRRTVGIDPGPGGHALATMLVAHTAGALMLPWSPRQAVAVGAVWVVVSSGALIWSAAEGSVAVPASIVATVAVAVPGTMIAFFRSTRLHDRFRVRALEDRYARVREELSAARQIHEGAFPQPRVTGEIRFAYEYHPMSQIGGDYVFAAVDHAGEEGSPVSLVLLDVTGHGIPAALTVNRLQGELARLVAEHPAMPAGLLLEQLNRYVYLTLAEQSVFVTAVALRADPGRATIEIASAGHPPVLVRRANGAMETYGASATVLGAQEPDEYRAKATTLGFEPGDSVVAFTDGVSESRDFAGRMFGVEGVRDAVDSGRAEASRRWPEVIARAVGKHRLAHPTDDTLIVELYRVGSGGQS